jgi:glucose/arabinose dehydrogenase
MLVDQRASERSSKGLVASGDQKAVRRETGDDSYRIEHFPVPKELDLLVGGMDFLPNGDLVVCTWPGEVYVVKQPQGPVLQATYVRFAQGLNEPLGLKVLGDEVYVVQKGELTRLRDTDGDGRADLQECINADWGYSGNYHSYAFGPLIDSERNVHVFITGQRGRWEMPFVGWCLKLTNQGRNSAGFCRGLRAPNGWAAFGPDEDILVTDNEGNWIGACKLNHLREGRFYGYPSGFPAPKEEFERPKTFSPPAVWFPRKLSPSASGIEPITDGRFGPFQGQLMVGDFQNSFLMRVELEKIKDEWQGAVWPFLKGFLGPVNRLRFGPDGKLYVGGGKRAWSTASPQEFALERVYFSGKSPFEVKSARAHHNGFDLTFTQPVDRSTATKLDNYYVTQFNYEYHFEYGSKEFDHDGKPNSATEIKVVGAELSEDASKVRLQLSGCREGYVTSIRLIDVTSADGSPLRHDTLYYTLNSIPP